MVLNRDFDDEVASTLLGGTSVVVVGPSNSGKTHWARQVLMPMLLERGKRAFYFPDGSVSADSHDIAIFDEAETFFDREHLEQSHPEERPYYTREYEAQVREWHKNYARHEEASIYLITRNTEEDAEFLVRHMKVADWDSRPLRVFAFPAHLS